MPQWRSTRTGGGIKKNKTHCGRFSAASDSSSVLSQEGAESLSPGHCRWLTGLEAGGRTQEVLLLFLVLGLRFRTSSSSWSLSQSLWNQWRVSRPFSPLKRDLMKMLMCKLAGNSWDLWPWYAVKWDNNVEIPHLDNCCHAGLTPSCSGSLWLFFMIRVKWLHRATILNDSCGIRAKAASYGLNEGRQPTSVIGRALQLGSPSTCASRTVAWSSPSSPPTTSSPSPVWGSEAAKTQCQRPVSQTESIQTFSLNLFPHSWRLKISTKFKMSFITVCRKDKLARKWHSLKTIWCFFFLLIQ